MKKMVFLPVIREGLFMVWFASLPTPKKFFKFRIIINAEMLPITSNIQTCDGNRARKYHVIPQ